MYVRHVFHSEHELASHFGQRFYERWQKLLRAYRERKKMVGVTEALRVTSVALTFIGAVEAGDAGVVRDFDNVLHGHGDMFLVDDTPLVANDDDSVIEPLMWDVACLMLDEHPEFVSTSQYAFDVASDHAWQAYNVMDDAPTKVVYQTSAPEPEVVDEAPSVVDADQTTTELKMLLDMMYAYRNKSMAERTNIRRTIMDTLFLRGIIVPKEIREEIWHFDDEHVVKIDATVDMLRNVSSVTFVENNGNYILSQTNNK